MAVEFERAEWRIAFRSAQRLDDDAPCTLPSSHDGAVARKAHISAVTGQGHRFLLSGDLPSDDDVMDVTTSGQGQIEFILTESFIENHTLPAPGSRVAPVAVIRL